MIVRKHFYPILILVVLVWQMIGPRIAIAGDIDWQIHWQDNGILQEEIQISGRDIIPADSNWQVSQEGDRYILRREVENWLSYAAMQDRMPLLVQSSNYLLYKKTDIKTGSGASPGLFQQLDNSDKVNLKVSVPGFIIGGSGERINESSARWIFNHDELLQNKKIMTVITIDGLLLGIIILFLGLIYVVMKFRKHLKKAEQIIEEEYSLTKIKPDEQKEGE